MSGFKALMYVFLFVLSLVVLAAKVDTLQDPMREAEAQARRLRELSLDMTLRRPTPFPAGGLLSTAVISPSRYLMVVQVNSKEIFHIKENGKVVLASDIELDEATRAFWRAVERDAPSCITQFKWRQSGE